MKTTNAVKKALFATLLMFFFSLSSVFAQHDTMYVMKNGAIVGQYDIYTEIDSVIFYKPAVEKLTSGTFTDARDSHIYHWITIGNQAWMAENLAYLPSVNQLTQVPQDTTGGHYYVYGYDGTDISAAKATSNYTTYGVLYDWKAAMASSPSSSTNPSGVQGVCPAGWHLPSHAEWTELTDYLGGTSDAGGKLKETDTTHWSNPNSFATNEVNFTALPGGSARYTDGSNFIATSGFWWTSTEVNNSSAYYRRINSGYSYIINYDINKGWGFSVRCLRN